MCFVRVLHLFCKVKPNEPRGDLFHPFSIEVLEGKVREGQTVYVTAKDCALEFREK